MDRRPRERSRRTAISSWQSCLAAPNRERISSISWLTSLASAFARVDLLFLDVDDIVVKFEAVRQIRIIYQAEDLERGAFYSRIVRQNWDFLPYLAIQRRAFKRRLLDGQSCGDPEGEIGLWQRIVTWSMIGPCKRD